MTVLNRAGIPALLAMCTMAALSGATISASGAGGSIPDCSAGNCQVGPGIPGQFTSDITILDPGSIAASGNNVTVTLGNISHTWVGDLQIALTHVGYSGATFLFRPGALTAAGVGNSTDLSGTYRFNNDFSGNPWTAGATLAPGDYYPTGVPFVSTESPFSDFFNGQPAAGTWRLTIYDLSHLDTGTIRDWSLDLQTAAEVPEPAQALPLLGALLVGAWRLRRRK
ncbi:MAG: proprotein convertase P-domain-containing protein [Acidobacteria bacterium]|nr:proprotein convertase P-domain-containing protein [Acidobacteriota bacterium]